MEAWAFAFKIVLVYTLMFQQAAANETTEGLAVSLVDSHEVQRVQEDAFNPPATSVEQEIGSDLNLEKKPSAGVFTDVHDSSIGEEVEEVHKEEVDPNTESGPEISELVVSTEGKDTTAKDKNKVDEEIGIGINVTDGEEKVREGEGQVDDDSDDTGEVEIGNASKDIGKAFTNTDQVSSNGDKVIKDPETEVSEEIINNNETSPVVADKILSSVETLFRSDEHSLLLRVPVPDKKLPSVSPVVPRTGIDGVTVYNERVYPGKICNETVEQESGDLEMPPPPLDSTCNAWSWTVKVGDGYFADVTLKALNVSHEADEFMILGPGSSVSDLWEDESNPMFTSVVTSEKKFRMLQAETFTVLLVTNTLSGFKGGFKLSYERSERVETTPVPTTPAPTLPSPAENVTTEIRVYLSGMTAQEFNETSLQFREVVASMSNIYCYENDIPMRMNSTSDNVVLSLIRQCDITWPYHDNCVQVNMSVAVILPTNHPGGFELTAEHLQDMWDTKADQPDSGLEEIGLQVYYEPNHKVNFAIWLGGSLIILILFIFILIVVWRVEIFRDYSRMNGKRDSEFSHRSSTLSDDSWFPATEHQLVPPYMDLYSDVGYVEYEPEFNGPVRAPKYQKPVPTTVDPVSPYKGQLPRYGPPPGSGYGWAVQVHNNTTQDFDNPAFVEEDEFDVTAEEEVNTGEMKYPIGWRVNSENNNSTC